MNLFREMGDMLRSVKHRRPAQVYCPRCFSPKIRLSGGLDFWFNSRKYVCTECGYYGPLVLELEKIEEKS